MGSEKTHFRPSCSTYRALFGELFRRLRTAGISVDRDSPGASPAGPEKVLPLHAKRQEQRVLRLAYAALFSAKGL
jgi:hypothetical protein